jgi:hypothetical protein
MEQTLFRENRKRRWDLIAFLQYVKSHHITSFIIAFSRHVPATTEMRIVLLVIFFVKVHTPEVHDLVLGIWNLSLGGAQGPSAHPAPVLIDDLSLVGLPSLSNSISGESLLR